MNQFNVVDKVCENFKAATNAIVFTHNIDFLFIESLLLPKLRSIGHPQLTVFADAACAAGAYHGQAPLIEKLGVRYRVVPIDLGAARRFHPKAFFLCSDDRAALAVGSGNTTHGGWSANQEIWSYFEHPEGGGSQITAFRDYLDVVLGFIPEPTGIREDTFSLFANAKNTWSASLPAPAGLAWTPNAIPMLRQITEFVSEPIEAIDVLSPYFDPSGRALTELAGLTSGPVRVRLQPGRAGLSNEMVAGLPTNVTLQSIESTDEDRRYKFIHAKAYFLKTGTETVVAAGSANCSGAALLAESSWGNAELMALSRVPDFDAADLLSDFLIDDTAPALPATHPSEDWELTTSDLRILSARKDGNRLEVFFKSAGPVRDLALASLESSAEVHKPSEVSAGKATFTVEKPLASIVLSGFKTDGTVVQSLPSWVDDERSLRIVGPERLIREKIDDAAARGSFSGSEFLQILELFDIHIQRPVPAMSDASPKASAAKDQVLHFTEADIFSDGFGRPPSLFDAGKTSELSETDTLELFLSFFQTKGEAPARISVRPRESDEDTEDDTVEAKVAVPLDDEKSRSLFGAKVLRALDKIETSLSRPEFLSSRSGARLSADIAFVSLLMTKARTDGYVTVTQFREKSLKLWKALFFGTTGHGGALPAFILSLEAPQKAQLVDDLSTAQLTAAMSLWRLLDWGDARTEGKDFRLSAAMLASRFPWLSQGGSNSQIQEELGKIATKLLPAEDPDDLFASWRDWLRDGFAVEALSATFAPRMQGELAALCAGGKALDGDLFWQSGHGFCSLVERRDKKVRLMPLGGSEPITVQSSFLAPVGVLLHSDIGISNELKQQIFSLMHGIDGAEDSIAKP